MIFGSKISHLILVQRNMIILQDRAAHGSKLPVDTTLVRDVEVLDADGLRRALVPFLHPVRGQRVLVVFDRSIVFDATVPDGDLAALTASFAATVPLDPQRQSIISHSSHKQRSFYATNAELVQALYNALGEVAAKVVAITPLAAYGKPQSLSKQAVVAHLLDDHRVAELVNFIKQ